MKRAIGLTVCLFIAGACWTVYALIHGYFDHGTFEVTQSQWSTSRQIAVVGRRTDNDALGGLQYFVAIGDHPFSSADLKHAYYYDGLAFRAGSDCLSIAWINDHELAVRCADRSIRSGQIADQKSQVGNVTIVYENIPRIAGT